MFRSGLLLGAVVCIAASLLARPCAAGVPSPPNCVYSPNVILGGTTGFPLTPLYPANFTIVIADVLNLPIAGAQVELDFSPAPTIRLTNVQNAGTIVDCLTKRLIAFTNASGVVRFNPRFAGWDNAPAVNVRANGVFITALPARSTAMNPASPYTDLASFALVTAAYGSPFPHPEVDFNVSGGPMDLGDFGAFVGEYVAPRPPLGQCP